MKRVGAVLIGGVVALAAVTAGSAGVRVLITGAEIRDNSIESRDIKNGTIRRADVAAALLEAMRGDAVPSGPQGATGPTGPQGPQGPPGPAGAHGNSISYVNGYSEHVISTGPVSLRQCDLPERHAGRGGRPCDRERLDRAARADELVSGRDARRPWCLVRRHAQHRHPAGGVLGRVVLRADQLTTSPRGQKPLPEGQVHPKRAIRRKTGVMSVTNGSDHR